MTNTQTLSEATVGESAGLGGRDTSIVVGGILAIAIVALAARGGGQITSWALGENDSAFSIVNAAVPALFAFSGWQHGSYVSGLARKPSRDVPWGIVSGVMIVLVTYLLVNAALLDVLGLSRVAASLAVDEEAVRSLLGVHVGGSLAGRIFSMMVACSAVGIMNTICLAAPFLMQAMATAGEAPAFLGPVSSWTQRPRFAVGGLGS